MQERGRQNLMLVAATALGWVAWLLYFASPVDLIPDLIPLLGWIDDVFGLSALLSLSWLTARRLMEVGERQVVLDYEPVPPLELRHW